VFLVPTAEDVVACRAAVLELARAPAEPTVPDVRELAAALAGVVEEWRAGRAGWVRTTAAAIHAIARSGALGGAAGATAFFLAHQILWDAGYGAATPDDDVELARHIAGAIDGAVPVDATEALLFERLGPNP
jgi:hypothetical protein